MKPKWIHFIELTWATGNLAQSKFILDPYWVEPNVANSALNTTTAEHKNSNVDALSYQETAGSKSSP